MVRIVTACVTHIAGLIANLESRLEKSQVPTTTCDRENAKTNSALLKMLIVFLQMFRDKLRRLFVPGKNVLFPTERRPAPPGYY